MNGKDMITHLGEKLLNALDREKEAIVQTDEAMLEKVGSEIDRLLQQFEISAFAGNMSRVSKLFSTVMQKREENLQLLEEQLVKTGKELGRVRSEKRVAGAYGEALQPDEIFIKKDC